MQLSPAPRTPRRPHTRFGGVWRRCSVVASVLHALVVVGVVVLVLASERRVHAACVSVAASQSLKASKALCEASAALQTPSKPLRPSSLLRKVRVAVDPTVFIVESHLDPHCKALIEAEMRPRPSPNHTVLAAASRVCAGAVRHRASDPIIAIATQPTDTTTSNTIARGSTPPLSVHYRVVVATAQKHNSMGRCSSPTSSLLTQNTLQSTLICDQPQQQSFQPHHRLFAPLATRSYSQPAIATVVSTAAAGGGASTLSSATVFPHHHPHNQSLDTLSTTVSSETPLSHRRHATTIHNHHHHHQYQYPTGASIIATSVPASGVMFQQPTIMTNIPDDNTLHHHHNHHSGSLQQQATSSQTSSYKENMALGADTTEISYFVADLLTTYASQRSIRPPPSITSNSFSRSTPFLTDDTSVWSTTSRLMDSIRSNLRGRFNLLSLFDLPTVSAAEVVTQFRKVDILGEQQLDDQGEYIKRVSGTPSFGAIVFEKARSALQTARETDYMTVSRTPVFSNVIQSRSMHTSSTLRDVSFGDENSKFGKNGEASIGLDPSSSSSSFSSPPKNMFADIRSILRMGGNSASESESIQMKKEAKNERPSKSSNRPASGDRSYGILPEDSGLTDQKVAQDGSSYSESVDNDHLVKGNDQSSAGNKRDAWLDHRDTPSIFDLFDNSSTERPRKSYVFGYGSSAMPKKSSLKTIYNDGVYLSGQAGEDAFFVRADALGVADGVGGWASIEGANPALYSRKLMHYVSSELEKLEDISDADYSPENDMGVEPKELIRRAYIKTSIDARTERFLGSTTALVAVLRGDELRIANLGDCGLMIIRNMEAVFRTEEQQHSFNFPFQLGTGSRDSPKDSQEFKVKIEEGDIVILGTDGMFDNVFDEDVVAIVQSYLRSVGGQTSSLDPQQITDALLRRAREVAEDTRYASCPFQSRAIDEGVYYQGGKMDDITVVAGIVKMDEDSPDRR